MKDLLFSWIKSIKSLSTPTKQNFLPGSVTIAIVESYTAFGVSAIVHICLISGIFITAMVFNEADKRPDALNETMKKFSLKSGYHSFPRARQNMWVNGQKVKLDDNDPGGEHE